MTDPIRLVEAALFSAGKPVSVDEIVQATKLKSDEVTASLKRLSVEYGEREGALEVGKSGTKWAMSVRTQYNESTKMLAAPEIPRKVLKTLALIAFHQPIKQSDLKDMVGSVVYDHVHELADRGMLTFRQEGITKILGTTDRFAEYFGIDAEDKTQIRTALAKAVGLDLSAVPSAAPTGPVQVPLEDANAPAAEPADDPQVSAATL